MFALKETGYNDDMEPLAKAFSEKFVLFFEALFPPGRSRWKLDQGVYLCA